MMKIGNRGRVRTKGVGDRDKFASRGGTCALPWKQTWNPKRTGVGEGISGRSSSRCKSPNRRAKGSVACLETHWTSKPLFNSQIL